MLTSPQFGRQTPIMGYSGPYQLGAPAEPSSLVRAQAQQAAQQEETFRGLQYRSARWKKEGHHQSWPR